jgi:hypothetical protein
MSVTCAHFAVLAVRRAVCSRYVVVRDDRIVTAPWRVDADALWL